MKSSIWQKPDVYILLKSELRFRYQQRLYSRARHAEQEELFIIHVV